MIARNVVRLECARRPYKVVLDNGVALVARSVVIATGAQYNKPRIANLAIFEGQGVYYGATYMEAQLCGDDDIIVVGGGKFRGPGRRLHVADSAQGPHTRAFRPAFRHDVPLSHPAH